MFNPFTKQLLEWYDPHRRSLPWKNTNDPYTVWVSEIILQQTRVEQGIPYFQRFIHQFSTVKLLASADIDQVFKLWEGLGYYSRARNLHIAAKQIVDSYESIFPNTYAEIRALKGIGDYTAAAIASFAYDLPYAVVDGNVYRVLSRYFAIEIPVDSGAGKKYFAKMAQSLLPPDQSALFNQAIMDFGALVCTPKKPLCEECPLSPNCKAYLSETVFNYPVKRKIAARTHRYFNYLVPIFDGKTILFARERGDIWAGLYEFPMVETKEVASSVNEIFEKKGWINKPYTVGEVYTSIQDLTHQRIHATFLPVYLNTVNLEGKILPLKQISDHAFPKIIREFLHHFPILEIK